MIKTRTLKQSITFSAPAHEVFELLIDEKKHAELTDSKTLIDRRPGGSFSTYDGGITGKNLEVVQDRKIVQLWTIETEGWPAGHMSRATFAFEEKAGKTKLTLTHADIPAAAFKDIQDGWKQYYWTPMKALLKKHV